MSPHTSYAKLLSRNSTSPCFSTAIPLAVRHPLATIISADVSRVSQGWRPPLVQRRVVTTFRIDGAPGRVVYNLDAATLGHVAAPMAQVANARRYLPLPCLGRVAAVRRQSTRSAMDPTPPAKIDCTIHHPPRSYDPVRGFRGTFARSRTLDRREKRATLIDVFPSTRSLRAGRVAPNARGPLSLSGLSRLVFVQIPAKSRLIRSSRFFCRAE